MKFYIELHKYVNRYFKNEKLSSIFPEIEIPWMEDIAKDNISGVSVPCMKIEKEFLFSVFHFVMHHMLEGIKWLVDICQYVDVQGLNIDFGKISKEVNNCNLKKLISIALLISSDITGRTDVIDYAKSCGFEIKKMSALENYIYKGALFENKSIRKRYLIFTMLPVKFKDRCQVIRYLLFDSSASYEGKSKGRERGPIKNIIHVLKRIIKAR